MSILDRIDSPAEIKDLKLAELKQLAHEVRQRILEVTSRRGGHVAPNLGTVELTIALHYVLDAPKDRIIWDVGHQCYTHKLLTGRRERFDTLRQYKGVSGFPRREESIYDVFNTGHAGTSISAAFGLAKARDMRGEDFKVVAVVGDGAIISGMALEALNHLGDSQTNLLVVLNDNAMSIARNPGALSTYLNRIITTKLYQSFRARVWNFLGRFFRTRGDYFRGWAKRLESAFKGVLTPGALFEDLGFHYFGPIDGHNLKELIRYFERMKEIPGPVLLHVGTEKGHGFKGATDNPEVFHGVGPFDPKSCLVAPSKAQSYSNFFGCILTEFAKDDPRIVAITAGMALGTGLTEFREQFPDRFFDFGINEEHCATFAAGLTLRGMKPVYAVYSTFLQRAFDQIIHDVALQNLPVVFAIDRSGVVGADGPTHHGVFDLSYLRMIPNMIVAAPKDEAELRDLLYTAIGYEEGPFAIRYPRSNVVGVGVPSQPREVPIGSWEKLVEGKKVAILATGTGVQMAAKTLKLLGKRCPTLVNARFIKPLDEKLLEEIVKDHSAIVTVEENALAGGFGSAVLEWLHDHKAGIPVERIGLPDRFIEHGSQERLLAECGVSVEGIARTIRRVWQAR